MALGRWWQALRSRPIAWGQVTRSLLPGAAVIAVVVVGRQLGWFLELELKALDLMLRWRPAEPQDERVLVVAIDDVDLAQLDTYPIPDAVLTDLIEKLNQHDPRVIGIDILRPRPVPPGESQFVVLLEEQPNLVLIDKILGLPVLPPPALPPEQAGFADFPLDPDGFVRRAYLGTFPEAETHPQADTFQFSLATRLARIYLEAEGMTLENGLRNRFNMRFGAVELEQFYPHRSVYYSAFPESQSGVQALINPRSGAAPFETVSMHAVLDGEVDPALIRDRVVLVGITAITVKDLVNSASVASENPGLVFGVDMHAHVVSQLLATVLYGRPQLLAWSNRWESGWVVLGGILGLVLVRLLKRPAWYALEVGLIVLVVAASGWVLLWLGGIWIPMLPSALLVFSINGLVVASFYSYDQMLRSRIDERQQVLESTYDAIHAGPLQTLALMLRDTTIPDDIHQQLEGLNKELRGIYNHLLEESLPAEHQFLLGSGKALDLRDPTHDVLNQVYLHTLERDFPGFESIKFKVIDFQPLATHPLSSRERRDLCVFLEEALCNVGKHTLGATRLTVLCRATGNANLIQVEDNGNPAPKPPGTKSGGRGTQQAQSLARRLRGHFQRSPRKKGTRCQLTWPLTPQKTTDPHAHDHGSQ